MKSEIHEWLVRAALTGTSELEMVGGVCRQLESMGVSLMRFVVATSLLDPTIDARMVRWVRGGETVEEAVTRTNELHASEDWTNSPFFFLSKTRKPLRRRLDATYRRGEFRLLDSFQDRGATDYVAFAERVGENMLLGEEGEGMMVSWLTDAPAGFTEAEVEMFAAIMPVLTLAFMLRTTNRIARTLITTYLGRDAAERVLAGNIVRGRAQPIRAIVWYSHLIGFTQISDTVSPDAVLALLNDYAEAQVEEIEAGGGHVLKFIGGGMLAIFRDDETTRACKRALDAAANLRRRIGVLNAQRESAGLPLTDTHLALHVGELLYGNLGSPRRLDFTVLGSAVNVAARIATLCDSLDQTVIVSWAFAEAAGDARRSLLSLGRYAMKGVARPQELFTLDPAGPMGSERASA